MLKLQQLGRFDINIAYDSACSYSINIQSRFSNHFTKLKLIIAKSQFAIDSLHVNDHIEKCMYLFSTAYKDCMGHFHSVGTEQYLSENNQMGPQTRQMNKGHHQDKIMVHHSDWNWKKTVKIGMLISDLETSYTNTTI